MPRHVRHPCCQPLAARPVCGKHLGGWKLCCIGIGDPACRGDKFDAAWPIGGERGPAHVCPLGAKDDSRGCVSYAVAQQREIEEVQSADVTTVRLGCDVVGDAWSPSVVVH